MACHEKRAASIFAHFIKYFIDFLNDIILFVLANLSSPANHSSTAKLISLLAGSISLHSSSYLHWVPGVTTVACSNKESKAKVTCHGVQPNPVVSSMFAVLVSMMGFEHVDVVIVDRFVK